MTVAVVLPLGSRGETHVSNGTRRILARIQGKTPELYGAVGDYDPDTDTGTDDTVAIQAWLDGLGPTEMGYFPPSKLYLCTATVATQTRVHLEGAGRTSGLFFKLADTGDDGLHLGAVGGTSGVRPILRNFAIYGRASPDNDSTTVGRGAINAYSIAFPDIDLYLDGRWDVLLRVVTAATFGTISQGGGIEVGRVRLVRQHNQAVPGYSWVPKVPYHGIYNRGWSNSVRYEVDLQVLGGHGVYLEGVYSAANGHASLRGSLQGISQTDTLDAVHIEYGQKVEICNLYTESNGGTDIALESQSDVQVRNCSGDLHLTTCTGGQIVDHGGITTIDADCVDVRVFGGASDDNPLVNASSTTATFGKRRWNTVTSARFPVVHGFATERNVLLNGDMMRWLAGASSNNVWGTRPGSSTHYYTGTKCGTGLADTTTTSNAPYCCKVQKVTSFGSSMAWTVFGANVLTGLVGQSIWVSVKLKTTQGKTYLQGSASNASIGNQIDTTGFGYAVENDFFLVTYAFAITSAIVTNGFDVRIHVPDNSGTATICYVSELMVGLGTHAPQTYVPCLRHPSRPDVRMDGPRLVYDTDTTPAGGDPLMASAWQVGDQIRYLTPTSGGNIGEVCTTAGSPGTWKTWGAIA